MDAATYLAFILVVIPLVVVPGPVVVAAIARTLSHGAAAGWGVWLGASLSLALQLLLAAVGIDWLLRLAGEWFDLIRWIGVAYLLYLAWSSWRAPVVAGEEDVADRRGRSALAGFIVSSTNPKSLLFLPAFLPQFVNADAAVTGQLVLLCITFLGIFMVGVGGYVMLAGRVRPLLSGLAARRWRNRISATLFAAMAAGLALARRG
jgi:threonine/homoserine/homoserine lactone efflux protein